MNNATECIWKNYHDKLHAFIRARVSNAAVAEDLLQEVFLRIHEKIGTLRSTERLPSWIYQLTRNAIIDHYRMRKTEVALPEDLALSEDEVCSHLRREIAGCFQPFIDRLPPQYREAVVMEEIEGLPQKEIARRLGITLSGAKSRVQRGRAMIKEMLLDCCSLEYDHRGNIVDYRRRGGACPSCKK